MFKLPGSGLLSKGRRGSAATAKTTPEPELPSKEIIVVDKQKELAQFIEKSGISQTNLPEHLQHVMRNMTALVDECSILKDLVAKKNYLSEMQRIGYVKRIEVIDAEIRNLARVAKIVDSGYNFVSPPIKTWVHGFVEETVPKDAASNRRYSDSPVHITNEVIIRGSMRNFVAVTPPGVVERYRRAKETGLFACFLVFSPRINDFERTVLTTGDPLLVGLCPVIPAPMSSIFVNFPAEPERVNKWEVIDNAVFFLIAQWDAEKDMKSISAKV